MKYSVPIIVALLSAPASAQDNNKWWLDCPGPACPTILPDASRFNDSIQDSTGSADKIQRDIYVEREKALEHEIESLRDERDYLRGELKDLGRY